MTAILQSKVAIVTGAARGIGLATAKLLADHGASVVASDIDAEALAQACESLGDRVCPVPGEILDQATSDRIVEAAMDRFGAIDILINNAGFNVNANVATMTNSEWQSMIDVHATAPFRLTRAAAPHMIAAAKSDAEAGKGIHRKVVNVSSCAIMGSAGQANYAAGKAAVVGLTKSLAKEWGRFRINVNAVALGSIDTRLTQARNPENTLRIGPETIQLGLSQNIMADLARSIPLGRIGTPEDAAGSIFLLCTPWADWVHGQVLVATGGQVFGMTA